jgi:hypothetical protein
MALLAIGVALAIIAAILVTTEEGPPPPSLALLLAEKRYAEVEVLARQRLEADPGDTEAGVYLELARSGLARAEGGAAGGGLAAPVPAPPCDLSLDVTSSFSGHAVVTVDGIPVIDEVFSVKSTRFFGRTVPGTWRPARATAEAEVESGRRRVIVRVTSKSGKVTVEETRDLTLPEDGRVELTAVASTDRLDLRVD